MKFPCDDGYAPCRAAVVTDSTVAPLYLNRALDSLKREDLVRILTEPKNAMTKQYQALMAYDSVTLEFEPDALEAIAKKAIERKSGARGLRAISEDALLDTLFDLPGQDNVRKCVITKDVIENGAKPVLEMGEPPVKQVAHRVRRAKAALPEEPTAS